jgi:hypothetical protein
MQWQLLWYVLAGLIIGFPASTLWEWLYFRRKRMDLRDQRLLELETELRLTRDQLHDLRAQTPPPPVSSVADYQSPGVFLESEEAESLRDEGYTPARGAAYPSPDPEPVYSAPSGMAPEESVTESVAEAARDEKEVSGATDTVIETDEIETDEIETDEVETDEIEEVIVIVREEVGDDSLVADDTEREIAGIEAIADESIAEADMEDPRGGDL